MRINSDFWLLNYSFVLFLLKHVLGLVLLMLLKRPDVHLSDSAVRKGPEVKS